LIKLELEGNVIKFKWLDPRGTQRRDAEKPDVPIVLEGILSVGEDQAFGRLFLYHQLVLLSMLCYDRNYIAIEFLRSRWSIELLLKGFISKEYSS